MSNMEFLSTNYINTTTQITVSTGTNTSRLFDREPSSQFTSIADNDDTTTTTITIEYTSAEEVNRIILENCNFKSFKLYYNSNSSNLFSLTSADTGTSQWTGNSATNLYLKLEATKTITSFTIEATATVVANSEKKIGQIWNCKQKFALENNPTAKDYAPKLMKEAYEHRMSDGGSAIYFVANKFDATLGLKFVTQTEYDNLKSLYDEISSFVFVPFPTSTSWESALTYGRIYEVNWMRDFTFEQYANNVTGNGFKGKIRMKETAR